MSTREQRMIEKLLRQPGVSRSVRNKLLRMHAQMAMPIGQILMKVPGINVSEKCRTLGIQRSTWYYWVNGTSRPGIKLAKQLERLTGYSVAQIRG